MTESLRESYGAFFERGQKLRMDAGDSDLRSLRTEGVPRDLWTLIPYAEFWGIPDDCYREELVEQAPVEILEDFHGLVSKHMGTLLEWLAGPEAQEPHPTTEYIAFSAMLMAFDYPRHTRQ